MLLRGLDTSRSKDCMKIQHDTMKPGIKLFGCGAKNLAFLQNQLKTSQIGYLYAINRSIMMQKATVIA
jgi:hypothetical protein